MAEGYEPKPSEGLETWESNNVIIKKVGRYAMLTFGNVTLDSSGYFPITLPEIYRPISWVYVYSKCYNGSSYVDCQVLIFWDGKIRLGDLGGAPISGLQSIYFQNKPIVYMTAQ